MISLFFPTYRCCRSCFLTKFNMRLPVGLVNDDVLPVELLEHRLLPKDHLVAGDTHVPPAGHHHVTDERVTSVLVT